MSEFNKVLLDDFIVVQMAEVTGTIKLPDWQRALEGRVIAAGPGKMAYSGNLLAMDCKVGDLVMFQATAGMDMAYAGKTNVRLMRDADVDMILDADPAPGVDTCN